MIADHVSLGMYVLSQTTFSFKRLVEIVLDLKLGYKSPNFIECTVLVMSRCCTHQLLNTYLLGIICIAGGKNGKENMEGLKTFQLSTVAVTLCIGILLNNLPVKGLILLDFLVFIAE